MIPADRAARLVFRPEPGDALGELCEAIAALAEADRASIALRAEGDERLQVTCDQEGTERAFGTPGAFAIGAPGAGEWVVAAWDRPPSPEQAARAVEVLRGAADARAGRESRLTLDRVLHALAHDLRNALFPLDLAVAILERQRGPDPQLDAIRRAKVAVVAHVTRALAANAPEDQGDSSAR